MLIYPASSAILLLNQQITSSRYSTHTSCNDHIGSDKNVTYKPNRRSLVWKDALFCFAKRFPGKKPPRFREFHILAKRNNMANFVAGPWAGQMSISGSHFQTRNGLGSYYSAVSSYFEKMMMGNLPISRDIKYLWNHYPDRRYIDPNIIFGKRSLLIGKTEYYSPSSFCKVAHFSSWWLQIISYQ